MRIRKSWSKIEWSKVSMVHNLFRIFEYIFGRKHGIRLENQTTAIKKKDGTYHVIREFYTIEALLVFVESSIYNALLRPVKTLKNVWQWQPFQIYVPVFTNYQPTTPYGYVFAIANDASTETAIGGSGGSPQSFSHTTAGSDRCLLGTAHWSTGTTTVTATYNSTSLSSEGQVAASSRGAAILSLIAPDTGSNSAEFTYGANADEFFTVSTFTGVDQTDCVDATGSVTGSYSTSYPKNISITTISANSRVVGAATDRENGITGAASGSTDLTYRLWSDPPNNTITGGTVYKDVVSAGAATVGWTGSGNNFINGVAVALKEATGGGGPVQNSNFLTLMQ